MKINSCYLEDIVDFFDYMRVPISTLEREKRQGIYPYYGAQEVIDSINAYIFDGEYVLIAEDGANLITRNQPISQIAKGKFWVNNHAHVVRAKDGLSTNYFVNLLINSMNLRGYVTGVAQPKLSQKNLGKVKISIPNFETQSKIENILSQYDDLIDTNRRQIKLLEESARLLFREWFVYFRFPGHEKVKIVDLGVRRIPAEWDYLPFTKIILFKKAPLGVPVFTDTRQYYQTSEIDGTSITGNGEEVDYENRPSRADITPRINTVYFAKMKDTEKVLYFNKGNAYLLEKVLLSTGMVGFTVDEKYLGFLFGLLTSYEFVQYKNNFATGATQVSLNDASLKKIKVLFPALNLVELYSEIVNPLFEECSLLRNQNQKLAQTRDLLLPRLMSGEIEV